MLLLLMLTSTRRVDQAVDAKAERQAAADGATIGRIYALPGYCRPRCREAAERQIPLIYFLAVSAVPLSCLAFGGETIQRRGRAVGAQIVGVDLLGSERAGDREAPHGRGDSGTDGGWQLPPELPPN
jgi:hypothetical protein